MEKQFTQKQIANWRRIRQNIESDVKAAIKIEAEIIKLQEKLKTLRESIDIQEYPVKLATNGFISQDIFIKEVISTGKVDANGREIKTTRYVLKYPETILPPVENLSTTQELSVEDEQCYDEPINKLSDASYKEDYEVSYKEEING